MKLLWLLCLGLPISGSLSDIVTQEANFIENDVSVSGNTDFPLAEFHDQSNEEEKLADSETLQFDQLCGSKLEQLELKIMNNEEQLLNLRSMYDSLNVTYNTCSASLASTTIQLIQTEKNASNFDVHLRLAKNEISIARIDVEHCKLDKELLQAEFNETVKRSEVFNALVAEELEAKNLQILQLTNDLAGSKTPQKTCAASSSIRGNEVTVEVVHLFVDLFKTINTTVTEIGHRYFKDTVVEDIPGYSLFRKVFDSTLEVVKVRVFPIMIHLLGFYMEAIERLVHLVKVSVGNVVVNFVRSPLYREFINPVWETVSNGATVVYNAHVVPSVHSLLIQCINYLEESQIQQSSAEVFEVVFTASKQAWDNFSLFWYQRTTMEENWQTLRHMAIHSFHDVFGVVHILDAIPSVHDSFGSLTNIATTVLVLLSVLVSVVLCLAYKTTLQVLILLGTYLVSPQLCFILVIARLIVIVKVFLS